MSDVRALLVGRDIVLGDAEHLERADPRPMVLEEWLRDWTTRLPRLAPDPGRAFVRLVATHEAAMRVASDEALRTALTEAAGAMVRQGFADPPVARAFAAVREAARRVLGKRHHDVQLRAGHALLRGTIAEMATGEGKTLAATLAVCTCAAAGAAVHVVTVNDYLAERDAEENGPLYAFFGFTVGVVKQDMPLDARREQYRKAVVYVSNKELTFDYLKDRIAGGGVLKAQSRLRRLLGRRDSGSGGLLRGLHVAVVDEADSVFIDEARTPLIISETLPDDLDPVVYDQALDLARQLAEGGDFRRGRQRDVWLTGVGEARIATLAPALGDVWRSALWRKELVQKALSALYLFQRDQHYIVADGKVQIVDEFTGRVMPDRTWERGLHQMIEAKEGCEVTGQRRTLSQITYQRFFTRYLLLSGMTGTAKEVGPELNRVYGLPVARIPTHRPSRRVRLADRVYATSAARWAAVADAAASFAGQGRAVLVGTRSVEASEALAAILLARGLPHVLLNARQDKDEAATVGRAGEPERITIATNMAGRGTDIKLHPDVVTAGGLHVILTEFHESARVDRQLFGRAARQGDPGSVSAIVCLDDELFTRFAPVLTRFGRSLWLSSNPVVARCFSLLVWYAQFRAERESRRGRLDAVKRDRQWQTALGFARRAG